MSARSSVAAILAYFDLSSDSFPWNEARCQQIERRRALMGDLLLFDILLRSGGIREPDTIYPPADPDTFLRLLKEITTSSYDSLKQDCLAYFLLKWYADGREDRFKTERSIPPHFSALSDAYWNLDAGVNVPLAVSTLSDSRLNTDYASKILQAISLTEDAMPLVLKYVRTAKPLLTEPDDIDLYTLALANSGLIDAWRFQRTFSEQSPTRPRLVKKILDWSLTPPRQKALRQLLGIAFSPYEQTLVEKHATPPSATLSATSIATLQHLLCVRLIQTGRFADAIKLDRKFSGASVSVPLQAERAKMVQEVYAALPAAERTMLDIELETPPTHAKTSTGGVDSSREMDTSMSWEDIRQSVIQQPVPFATPQKQPLFGSSLPLNGKPNETPSLSKFPGFGQTPSAFPPLSFASPSSSRPLVPVQPTVSTNGPQNAFSSLAKSTIRPLGSPTTSSAKNPFESANKRQNAFYRPPAAASTSVSAFRDNSTTNGVPPPRDAADINMVEDIAADDDQESAAGADRNDDDDERMDEEADTSLAFSVFSSKPLARPAKQPATTTKRSKQSTSAAAKDTKRRPPGAFVSDEDPDDAAPQPSQPPSQTRTRRSVAAKSAPVPLPPIKTTRRRVKEQKGERTLPGSLMASEDEEDGSDEAEEADRVAPLPKRATAPVASEDGVQTRRRSSRLSSVEPESSKPPAKAPGRTKSVAGGSRKRRT
ncbi:nuclear pore complex assembly-domain-containing protein [Mycena amicta]|nr:nuclear pore complex assembly-domain-containing protein [Mycena amicta]